MVGKIYIMSTGYDPTKGKHVNDPFLGPEPTLGACRPDFRERLGRGDHIFVVTGKVRNESQLVLAGFEIAEKISAYEAFERFPQHRLREREDGQVTGNVIVTASGEQHELDHHDQFERRAQNYIVGANPIALVTHEELDEGRLQTLDILRDIFQTDGDSVINIMGRNHNMNEAQIIKMRDYLDEIKKAARPLTPGQSLAGRQARA